MAAPLMDHMAIIIHSPKGEYLSTFSGSQEQPRSKLYFIDSRQLTTLVVQVDPSCRPNIINIGILEARRA